MTVEESIYFALQDCVDEIHELIEEEKKDMHFLKEALYQVRELENRIIFHRKLFMKPQTTNLKVDKQDS